MNKKKFYVFLAFFSLVLNTLLYYGEGLLPIIGGTSFTFVFTIGFLKLCEWLAKP